MVEGIKIDRMRVSARSVRENNGNRFEGPTDSDLMQIQDSEGDTDNLTFSPVHTSTDQDKEPSHSGNGTIPTSEYDYLGSEERAVLNFFVPLPTGITQRRIAMLLHSVERKVQEAQFERKEDEAKDRMRTTVEKTDPKIREIRERRRVIILEASNRQIKAKEARERAEKDRINAGNRK